MCFGLACGLDFIYIESEYLSPLRFFNGRTPVFEPILFQNIGLDIQWNTSDEFPWQQIRRLLDRNIPVLVFTDLYYLDYYNSKTHFSLHGIVIAGHDEERGGICFVADTERPGLQETAIGNLSKAMASHESAVSLHNNWLAIEKLSAFDLAKALERALVFNSERILYPSDPLTGIPALKAFVSQLETWDNLEDWKWAARFGYQSIERRGTGGGAFRKMYALFLRDAEDLVANPGFKKTQASARMRKIAGKWTDLAMILKEISEGDRPNFAKAVPAAREIINAERKLFEDLQEAMNTTGIS